MSFARKVERHRAQRRIGPIFPGERLAAPWTFTKDRWTRASYLWLIGDEVYLSAVQATQQGNGYLRDLIAGIEAARLRVVVPNVLGDMQRILEHYGFAMTLEESLEGSVDIWRRP